MFDMTFPEFEAAVAKTHIALLPIGAIENTARICPLEPMRLAPPPRFFMSRNICAVRESKPLSRRLSTSALRTKLTTVRVTELICIREV
jgi:hypothetical protein